MNYYEDFSDPITEGIEAAAGAVAPEGTGATPPADGGATPPAETTLEDVFGKLDEASLKLINSHIDRERQKASTTAYLNAQNKLKNDEVFKKTIKDEIEREVTLTNEEKYAQKLKDLSLRENIAEVKGLFAEKGVPADDVFLSTFVTEDKDMSLSKATALLDMVVSQGAKVAQQELEKKMKTMTNPQTNVQVPATEEMQLRAAYKAAAEKNDGIELSRLIRVAQSKNIKL